VCLRKTLHTKSILAAIILQNNMLQMRYRYAATVRNRAYIFVRVFCLTAEYRWPQIMF
jgi:hypothetical protein